GVLLELATAQIEADDLEGGLAERVAELDAAVGLDDRGELGVAVAQATSADRFELGADGSAALELEARADPRRRRAFRTDAQAGSAVKGDHGEAADERVQAHGVATGGVWWLFHHSICSRRPRSKPTMISPLTSTTGTLPILKPFSLDLARSSPAAAL